MATHKPVKHVAAFRICALVVENRHDETCWQYDKRVRVEGPMDKFEFITTVKTSVRVDEATGRSIVENDVTSTAPMSLARHIQIGASVALEIVEELSGPSDDGADARSAQGKQ